VLNVPGGVKLIDSTLICDVLKVLAPN